LANRCIKKNGERRGQGSFGAKGLRESDDALLTQIDQGETRERTKSVRGRENSKKKRPSSTTSDIDQKTKR